MSPETLHTIENTTKEIMKIVADDKTINHCRINVINGIQNVFTKYKQSLSHIEEEGCISVKFYVNHESLHEDLFPNPDFMAKDWFNLFVFNIGKNGKTVGYEMSGVDLITLELRNKFDSKYYSTLIVSELEKKELSTRFKQETGRECPVKNYRYLGYNFDGVVILDYLEKILHTHSTAFLSRWSKALDNLEKLKDRPTRLSYT